MSEVAMKVAVRVRPFSRREMEQNQKNIIRVLDTSTLVFDPDEDEDEFFFHGAKQTHRDITKRVKKKLNMEFDSVFHDQMTNEEVFEICTKPIITSVMNGFNCSVFVYGATGAGKTFTMLGSENNLGITFLTMRELFAQMDQLEGERRFDIGISYLEVYNEQVMNLLTKSGPLKLREDASGVIVGGLVLKQIFNANELINLLILGNKNRTQHPTDANEESSRSHAIFQVHIRMTDKKTSVRKTVKLSMIDLAGSERAQSTKCKGLRFKEGANINKSLLALGNCINKLADGSKHIPYRDSNLTRILKDSLGGNCQTLMIANVSPSSLTYEDTYNTLKYASRAKTIRTTLRQNVITTNMPKEFLLKKCNAQVSEIEKLKMEIEKLKERNKILEAQVIDQSSVSKAEKCAGDSTTKDVNLSVWHVKIDKAYDDIIRALEKCLSLQSQEKVLNFRIKFKERYNDMKRVLTLDGSKLEVDLKRLGASIDKYSKEAARIKHDELARWAKRLKEANKAFHSLKGEIIEKKLLGDLKQYLAHKQGEVEMSKLQLKSAHVNKINSVYQLEVALFHNIILSASEILQDNYLLLRSCNELDNSLIEKFTNLEKLMQGHRSVKFSDTEEPTENQAHDNPIGQFLNLTDFDQDAISTNGHRKRINEEEEDDSFESDQKKSKNSTAMEDFQFARPSALKSINFGTSSTAMKVDSSLNQTFDIDGIAANETIVLSERTNHASTSTAFKVPKPGGAGAKFTLNINKENRKFSPGSNRVKKATRTPSRVAGSKDYRPKLVKSAVASALVLMPPGKDKFKTLKKKT